MFSRLFNGGVEQPLTGEGASWWHPSATHAVSTWPKRARWPT
jgi:hypothetical protein